MKNDKQLIAWLNDAYAMERSLANVLENHAKDASAHPDLKAMLEKHLDETHRHADLVEQCLGLLGEKPSAAKALAGSAMGAVQGIASGMFSDELIKNLLSDYSAEHMEIASYSALIAAAEKLGHLQIVNICTDILREEKAMAAWLQERIPTFTHSFLERKAA